MAENHWKTEDYVAASCYTLANFGLTSIIAKDFDTDKYEPLFGVHTAFLSSYILYKLSQNFTFHHFSLSDRIKNICSPSFYWKSLATLIAQPMISSTYFLHHDKIPQDPNESNQLNLILIGAGTIGFSLSMTYKAFKTIKSTCALLPSGEINNPEGTEQQIHMII